MFVYFVCRFLVNAPHLGKNLKQFAQFLIENLSHLMSHMKQQREQLSAKISCHLAITEYRGSKSLSQDTLSIMC